MPKSKSGGHNPAPVLQQYQDHIEQVVRDTEAVLKVHLTIHDLTGIFRGTEGQWLLEPPRSTHQHPYCRMMKTDNEQQCIKECQHYANREASRKKQPWIHRCWAGAAEVVVPIIRDRGHLFTIFIGLFRGRKARSWKSTARDKKADRLLPVITGEQAERLGNVVATLGQGLLTYIEDINKIHYSSRGRKGEVRRLLHYHAHEKMSLGDLARILHLSLSRTSHLITELFGMSFKSLLLQERIQRARVLLLSGSDWTVGDIGRQVGMPDEYHFNRAFKKRIGIPPGQFRKQHRVNI